MKRGVFRNFAKFIGKHLCQGLFFNKRELKKRLCALFSCEFCEISKNTFLTEHLWTTASDIIQLSFAIFPHKTIWYFLVRHILFPAKSFLFYC